MVIARYINLKRPFQAVVIQHMGLYMLQKLTFSALILVSTSAARSDYQISPLPKLDIITEYAANILAKSLPNACTVRDQEVSIETDEEKYEFKFDGIGEFKYMAWSAKAPMKHLSKKEFAILAKNHRCGNGQDFIVESGSITFHEPTGEIFSHETFIARYKGNQKAQLELNPNIDMEDTYELSCEIQIDLKQQGYDELCKIGDSFCPKVPAFRWGGSRF